MRTINFIRKTAKMIEDEMNGWKVMVGTNTILTVDSSQGFEVVEVVEVIESVLIDNECSGFVFHDNIFIN